MCWDEEREAIAANELREAAGLAGLGEVEALEARNTRFDHPVSNLGLEESKRRP